MTHPRGMGTATQTEAERLRAELARERERRAQVEIERDTYLEQLLRARVVVRALGAQSVSQWARRARS
jgi:hypothetical protein